MKTCRFCNCSWHGFNWELVPSWVVDEPRPLIAKALAICSCPCHYMHVSTDIRDTYIEAIQEIFAEELYPQDGAQE